MRIGRIAQNQSSALICAAQAGHRECVSLLVEAGADKDSKDWVRDITHCFGVVYFCGGLYFCE